MKVILDVVDYALGDDRPAYVRCWRDRGRTGTVVGCYIARHDIALGEDALERIVDLRQNGPIASQVFPENDSQCSMVRDWREGQ